MKKILIFSTAYFPFVGGAEVAIKEITDRLLDIEFHLITALFDRTLKKEEKIGNVIIHRIGWGIPLLDKLWLPWGGALKTIRLHRKYKFDLFWAVMATFASGAAYIANFFIQPKVPIVLTLQEGDSEKYLRFKWAGLVDISWRLALWRADFLTVISTYLGYRARRLGYKGKMEIIPNGVDLSVFTNFPKFGTDLKGFIENNQPYYINLVTTSRLVKKNAVDDIIKGIEILIKEDKRATKTTHKLFIFGDGPLRSNLEQSVAQRGIGNNVKFRGYRTHQEIIENIKKETQSMGFMNALFVFIRPSRSEGMGNSFIEAMAAGLPVIATQEGGITDFLFDAKRNPDKPTTGWAVDKDNPEQIAEAVKEIVGNPEQTKRVVETARKMAYEKYDWNLIARNIKERVFDAVLADHK